jgi:hypothetical protein
MSWWEALSEYLDELERTDGDAPDPWAEVDLGRSSLTDEQVAFLAFDQPPVPRLGRQSPGSSETIDESPAGDPGDGTGKTPGDG